MNPTPNWTKDRVDQLIELWRSGFNYDEIGKRLGITREQAKRKSCRMHLSRQFTRDSCVSPETRQKILAMREQGIQNRDICYELKIGHTTLWLVLKDADVIIPTRKHVRTRGDGCAEQESLCVPDISKLYGPARYRDITISEVVAMTQARRARLSTLVAA